MMDNTQINYNNENKSPEYIKAKGYVCQFLENMSTNKRLITNASQTKRVIEEMLKSKETKSRLGEKVVEEIIQDFDEIYAEFTEKMAQKENSNEPEKQKGKITKLSDRYNKAIQQNKANQEIGKAASQRRDHKAKSLRENFQVPDLRHKEPEKSETQQKQLKVPSMKKGEILNDDYWR